MGNDHRSSISIGWLSFKMPETTRRSFSSARGLIDSLTPAPGSALTWPISLDLANLNHAR
jgi:hypothetical protein